MTVHLLRVAVGIDDLDHLARVQHRRLQEGPEGPFVITQTRFAPKRADEVLDGGSLYWVIKNYVRARQRILDIRRFEDTDGKTRCALVLDPELVRTEPRYRRAHQGWRYLEPKQAAVDLSEYIAKGAKGLAKMPPELLEELRDLGLV